MHHLPVESVSSSLSYSLSSWFTSSCTSSQSLSSLSPSPIVFYSRLKTHLFRKSSIVFLVPDSGARILYSVRAYWSLVFVLVTYLFFYFVCFRQLRVLDYKLTTPSAFSVHVQLSYRIVWLNSRSRLNPLKPTVAIWVQL